METRIKLLTLQNVHTVYLKVLALKNPPIHTYILCALSNIYSHVTSCSFQCHNAIFSTYSPARVQH